MKAEKCVLVYGLVQLLNGGGLVRFYLFNRITVVVFIEMVTMCQWLSIIHSFCALAMVGEHGLAVLALTKEKKKIGSEEGEQRDKRAWPNTVNGQRHHS